MKEERKNLVRELINASYPIPGFDFKEQYDTARGRERRFAARAESGNDMDKKLHKSVKSLARKCKEVLEAHKNYLTTWAVIVDFRTRNFSIDELQSALEDPEGFRERLWYSVPNHADVEEYVKNEFIPVFAG